MNPGICDDEIQDCAVNSLSDSMLWRKLLRKVGNCFSLNISGSVTVIRPINSATLEHLIEEDTNTLMLAALNLWKSNNPSFTVVEKIQINSVDKQSILITYTI